MKPEKPPSKPVVELRGFTLIIDGVEQPGSENFIATGVHARRVSADLDELRALRLKRTGGSVFRRKGSRFWQIKYPDGKDGWVYESAHTQNRQDAEALLRLRAYEASAGNLPGTATFGQIVERLLDAAKIGGLKSVARMARAGKALRGKFEGCRAEQIDNGKWREYVKEREEQVAPDTVYYERSIAKRAYRLAFDDGLVRSIPKFPRIKNLRVRQGFVDPGQWEQLRAKLSPDFGDAADFAFVCGARQMEVLSLTWAEVERDHDVINLRRTKTGRPRVIPYGVLPELVEMIERRAAVAERLKHAGVISPWVFCFSTAGVRRPAGSPLFERAERKSGERGLCKSLRKEWRGAAAAGGLPVLQFHDLRRSAARNLERAGVPRSIAMQLGGWSDKIYSRYAIAGEREIAPALGQLGDYLRRKGWHSGGSREKSSAKSRRLFGGDGRSRTYDTADMSRML